MSRGTLLDQSARKLIRWERAVKAAKAEYERLLSEAAQLDACFAAWGLTFAEIQERATALLDMPA